MAEIRFATTPRMGDNNKPGLLLQDDGTIWWVGASGIRTQLGSDSVAPPTSALTVETDPDTFQAEVLLDFGADFLGGAVGVEIKPVAFEGNGETFGGAGGAEIFLNTFLAIETSSNLSDWVDAVPLVTSNQTTPDSQNVSELNGSIRWSLLSARFLRWMMQIEDADDAGIYAGSNHPVLTVEVAYRI